MAAKSKTDFGDQMVVHREDQEKINLFARKTSLFNDLQSQICAKEKELRNLEDASDELLLADDEDFIPYTVGEVFVRLSVEDTQKRLEEAKQTMQANLSKLREKAGVTEDLIKKTKSELYAKFGDNINLEADR